MRIGIYKQLTVKRCRDIMGKEAEGLSDAEVLKVRDSLSRKLHRLHKKDDKDFNK